MSEIKQYFVNCSINTLNGFEENEQPQQIPQPFSEEDMTKLIEYIKTEIDLKLPNEIIREILDAEFNYFQQGKDLK